MLKINLGAESAAMLEKTRRAVNDLQSSVKRISSGIAIESAGDDPGAIGSVVFTETAISGIQRTLKNLNEGITITQALSSDLNLVEKLLLTLRDVAEQAASDQFTDTQRADLQADAQSILRKIDIAVKQAGAEYGYDLTHNDSITISGTPELSLNTQIVLTDLLVEDLGKRAIYTSQRNGVFTSALTDGDLIINGVTIRATTNDDDTLSTAYQSGSAIAKALAINVASEATGVSAEAGPTSITGNRSVSEISLTGLNYFSINGSVINGVEVFDLDSNFASLENAINTETRFTGVSASITAEGALSLSAEDGRNIQIRYSNQDVLKAIGVTDKEGDLANMFGAVELGSPDRDLNGEVQTPISTNFLSYDGTNVSVGGRFDASEDYVDFVAQIINPGSFGTAQFRLDRDPISDVTAVEDFAFIEGDVNPILDTTGVVNGDFISTGGFAVGSGTYNEAIDRDYILTVTKDGTTDGVDRAEFSVSTAQDGVVGSFTASALVDINIAGPRTGEDVAVYFSASPRNSELTANEAVGHEYDSALSLGGTYNGNIDSVTTIEVVTSGRTQGTPQAFVQVYHDGVAYNGPVAVSADSPIDIGNGQTISFAGDLPIFSAVTSTSTGTYSQAITVDSNPEDFTGIGAATYELEITTSGAVGEARYIVNKDGSQISAGDFLVTAGTNLLADGLSFNIPDAPPTIGATTVTTSHAEDTIDHYQDYAGIIFSGNYDGSLDETSLEVRVKREGIVLAAGDSTVGRDDYAILEYRFGGAGAFTGDIAAREGGIAIERGVSFDLPTISADPSIIETSTGIDHGTSSILAPLSVGGYNGDIEINLDQTQFTYGDDVKLVFSSANPMQIPETNTQTETLTVKLVKESDGTVLLSTDIQPVSGVTETIGQGIDLTFTNTTGASLNFTANGANDDFGSIALEAGASYNGNNDNDEILFRFENTTNVSVTRENVGGNDGVSASVGANVYNGLYGDKTITLELGQDPVASVDLLNNGPNAIQDASTVSLNGTYTGANSNDDIRLRFLNRVSVDIEADQTNNDGSFSMAPSISGSNDINRAYADLNLDIAVSKSIVTQATSTPEDVTIIGSANGAFFGDFTFWRVNSQKFRLEVTPEGGTKSQVEYKFSDYVSGGVLDLGDAGFSGVFGGSDPGFDLDVSSASVGQQYDFNVDEVFEYTFTDPHSGTIATTQSVASVIDLNSADLSSIFTNGDPEFDLLISNESDAVDDQFSLSWQIDPTVEFFIQSGGAEQNNVEVQLNLNVDETQATYDLIQANLPNIFSDGDSGLTLVVDNPLDAIDDTYGILGVNPSVNLTDGTTTVEGIALLDIYTLSDPAYAALFPDGSPGDVVINLTNKDSAVNDKFHISLESTSTVHVSERNGTNSRQVTVQADGTIDMAQANITALLNNNTDPGFDLKVNDLDRGIDDQYLLQLSSLPTLSTQADEQIALINQHSLQVDDLFAVDLGAEKFALGDTYSVFVDSEHLQDGTVYSVNNTLGKFLVGDEIILSTTHDFQAPTYTVDSSVNILNGLTLDFGQNGTFELGDEVRFQVRGYTGDPIASGTYSNAISPTTFTIEVTSTGDVDGGATFQYTRADTGETVGGFAVSSTPTLLDDGVEISFSAGRVYEGDIFYIETFESLDQTFGGKLSLKSANTIDIEMADANSDNLLGRITYNGDTPTAPGTAGNSTKAFLALNQDTAVGQIDLRTQQTAQKAVEYTGNAQESLKFYQNRVGLAQAQLEDLSNNLEGVLIDQADLLQQKLKVDVAQEGDRSSQAIQQIASNTMLASVRQQSSSSPINLLQQSFVAVEAPNTQANAAQSVDPISGKTQAEKNKKNKQRLKEQERQKAKSAQRLDEMKRSIENAQKRSSAMMANMSALRELASAHIEANQTEARIAQIAGQGKTSPKPNDTFDKLLNQVSNSTKAVDTNPAQREAQEAIKRAESTLREMKALALAAQSASQFEREGLQAQLQQLVVKLQEQDLSSAVKPQGNLKNQADSKQASSLVFNTATARQLGQYSSSQSPQGVDSKKPLQDGELNIITALGQKIPVRSTLPSDDQYSVREVLGSALAKATAINSGSAQHGVSAIAGPTVAFSDQAIAATNLSNGSFFRLNGAEITDVDILSGDSNGALKEAINRLSQSTGIQASSMQGGRLRLMAFDGRNITVDAYGDATKLGLTPVGSAQAESRTTGGSLTLSSRQFFTLQSFGYGASASPALGNLSSVPNTQSLSGLDLSSTRNVIDTLSVIDLALADLQALTS